MTADRPTNFFARQAAARKSCRRQMILFIGAVAIVVVVTSLAIRLVWYLFVGTQAHTLFNAGAAQSYRARLAGFSFFDPAFFLFAGMVIVMIILAASLYKMHTLKKGGPAVAEMLGGRRVDPGATDPDERRLVNVVEEMAIASGIPLPRIYVLDAEHNINAFAAGLEFSDAAVAVTRGALVKLNRDELQGVIAHEFSHILNGDARLNMQLIGILFGVMFMGIVGRRILAQGRIALRLGVPIIVGGVCLLVIGYVGTFLGRLMQRAISRQKEYLADASAVQFTRNPLGLAGALKKIGGSAFGARIRLTEARQASHLFFGESHPNSLFSFLATHPPLVLRIRLLDPSFDGKFIKTTDDEPAGPKPQYTTPFWGTTRQGAGLAPPPGSPLLAAIPALVVDRVGRPTPENIVQSRAVLTDLPEDLHETARTPQGAASLVYALVIGADASRRSREEAALSRALVLEGKTERVFALGALLAGLSSRLKLPLLELAMPSLAGLDGLKKRNFLLVLQLLIDVDGRMTLPELSCLWILEKYLNPAEELFRTITKFSFAQVGLDTVTLLGSLASAGHPDDRVKAQAAFDAGLSRIPELCARRPAFPFKENASYADASRVLTNLTAASFKIKETVIDACAHCAFADSTVTFEEGELLRVIALALQCPLPPFIELSPIAPV
ncbi:MAG: M48 family metallopeptidase [Smithellaceae bacterium]|nr:M48 family metallopeptidase [Syntrophaceae bacterium]MDD4242162.1 M48 family metallopeptidase [Smithellaceae bacterium]NLX53001.1 M48 family metallopeptidase [Deltaproteobacteria bacterium]